MSCGHEARASDAEREAAVTQLRDAHVDGRLTLGELSSRSLLAYGAKTHSELERLVDDVATQPIVRSRPRRFGLGVLGGPTFAGRWRAGKRLFLLTLLGGADVDLRQAVIDGPAITIVSLSILGGNDYYVPPDTEVDLLGFSLTGGHDEVGRQAAVRSGSPLVRIRAFSLLGGSDVHYLGPSEKPSLDLEG